MTIGPFTLSPSLIAILAIGVIWLITVVSAMAASAKIARVLVGAASLLFAGAWMFTMMTSAGAVTKSDAGATKVAASCATVDTGDAEEAVRSRMGEPGEKRGEEELRGPGANVWVYRESRCAVHFLDGVVESVD